MPATLHWKETPWAPLFYLVRGKPRIAIEIKRSLAFAGGGSAGSQVIRSIRCPMPDV
jgi:hypothetical protein